MIKFVRHQLATGIIVSRGFCSDRDFDLYDNPGTAKLKITGDFPEIVDVTHKVVGSGENRRVEKKTEQELTERNKKDIARHEEKRETA